MKTIIVYYSLENNTNYAAEKIAEKLGADLLRLEPVKAYPTGKMTKFIFGGRSAMMKERPALQPYEFDTDAYDCVILGTPVWASTFTPPVRTFLQENNLKGKKIGLFACSTGGDATKCFDAMKKELIEQGITDIGAEASFIDPYKNQTGENEEKIHSFCAQIAL
ncbi:MAG: flavodoxin [Lachnospiraceae bacterium]|nr:flavodoxin [Lachnospiraceae bacterium]